MAFNIKDRGLQATLERYLGQAQRDHSDSLEKLSSGVNYSKQDPRPADRALAEGLEFKLRGLSAARRNINMTVNMLQTAESSLSEVTNMVLRMKEINIAATNSTVSDKERRFLFIEYEALHEEVSRIALTTEFNGIPLLNGQDPRTPEELVFRVGDPTSPVAEEDINQIHFAGLKSVVATADGLGLRSARSLLESSLDDGGISLDDARELLPSEDSDLYPTVYDEALHRIADQRATFGALQSRMDRATDHIEVFQENLAAAKSSIADVDYAKEVGRMIESRLLLQASTAMMAQSNINSQLALNLLHTLN